MSSRPRRVAAAAASVAISASAAAESVEDRRVSSRARSTKRSTTSDASTAAPHSKSKADDDSKEKISSCGPSRSKQAKADSIEALIEAEALLLNKKFAEIDAEEIEGL